jgi:FlaA1/EpsC-like NDP-sugar epimerase
MIRLFGCETTISDLKFAIWQTAIFFLAFVIPMLAQAMAHNTSDVPNFTAFALLLEGVLFAGLLSTSMFAFGLDARALSSSDNAFPVRLALAILAGGVLIAVAFHLLPIFTRGSAILPASLALAFAGILATRRLTQWLVRSGGSRTRAIILGAGESAV